RGTREEKPESAKGEGFVMKESAPQETAPHQIDFATLVLSFATSSLMNMGLAPDPQTNQVQKNLPLAQQNIDILLVLRDKTKGNLSPDENELLESLLREVQLRFVEISKKK